MRKWLSRLAFVVGAASLVGCAASHKYFLPTENLQGETWRGYDEAKYQVSFANEEAGVVNVWSQGAFKVDDDLTVIRIGFEVVSSSNAPLTLSPDSVRLDILTKKGEFDDVEILRVAGNTTVARGQISDVVVDFAVPNEMKAGDVGSYRVRWQVESEGRLFVQTTPFKRAPSYVYDPYYPYGWYGYPYGYPYGYYDPFWGPGFYPGWSFNLGFGFGGHHHRHH